MESSLLAKKNRLVQETAAKVCAGLDPVYQGSLVRCLNRLDILSVRTLDRQNLRLRVPPAEVALVGEDVRAFGWAVWLAILTDARLDDPEWLLKGLHCGSDRWGFSAEEARLWRREYLRAHTAVASSSGPPPPSTALETVR